MYSHLKIYANKLARYVCLWQALAASDGREEMGQVGYSPIRQVVS